MVEVNYGDSEILYLEFFSTLPIEELLKSRAGSSGQSAVVIQVV